LQKQFFTSVILIIALCVVRFDRAVSLAAQFERTEIRMMAQLKLAQGILAGPPKRFKNY
jgi:hypothetical protein